MLIESSAGRADVRIIGVGMNIATRLLDQVDTIDSSPTSIIEHCARLPRRYQWLQPCVENILDCVQESFEDSNLLAADYRRRCALASHNVRCQIGDQAVIGVCESIDDMGRLQVRAQGRLLTLSSGEVLKIRESENRAAGECDNRSRGHPTPGVPSRFNSLATSGVIDRICSPRCGMAISIPSAANRSLIVVFNW